MSSGSDPKAITDAVADAEDAFDGRLYEQTYEEHIETGEDWKIQFTKACRVIDAAKTIRENNGHYTAVIELCFGGIERSLEAWLIASTGNDLEDLQDHTTPYERADSAGLFSGTGEILLTLYEDNRTESYYADRRPTEEQADAMLQTATAVHNHIGDQIDHDYCTCE